MADEVKKEAKQERVSLEIVSEIAGTAIVVPRVVSVGEVFEVQFASVKGQFAFFIGGGGNDDMPKFATRESAEKARTELIKKIHKWWRYYFTHLDLSSVAAAAYLKDPRMEISGAPAQAEVNGLNKDFQ